MKKMFNKVLTTANPFEESTFKSMGGIDYIIGSLFFLLALVAAMYIKKARDNLRKYKAEQFKEYQKNNPKSAAKNYSQTKLYVPIFERAKSVAPVMFAILFVFVGITWMVGHPIQTL